MSHETATVLAVFLCLALVACNQTTANVLPAPAMNDHQALSAAYAAVLARMKDPDSAKIMNMHRVGEYVCGEVNSKNGFGGYAGAKKFSVSPSGEVLIAGESVELGVWASTCWSAGT
jgi:hypothetical protein